MDLKSTSIDGVVTLTPRRFEDDRGFLSETWSAAALRDAGLDLTFVQENHSYSEHAGTVRGLHFQRAPHAQGKLVRVVRGCILDVAVDLRPDSPTFGAWVSAELSSENWMQMYVPPGFAHGFVTRAPGTEVVYRMTAAYAPEAESGIHWLDPELGIDWGVRASEAVLSEKDAALPSLRDTAL